MTEKFQPKGCVTELDFGSDTKMEVYTNLISDIPKLGEIDFGTIFMTKSSKRVIGFL